MAAVLLTYDISGKHTIFKQTLINLGYTDTHGGSNLPNTTMHHANTTATIARDQARSIASSLGIDLERCFAVEISTWAGIVGAQHG